jgi:predicted aldo/keto reductase-like oxidoreductase
MQYRKFGNLGHRISALGFGAMRLPMKGENVDEEASIAIIHRAFELGVNYIDTAEPYCSGQSEIVVGKALKGWRDKVWLSTKNWKSDQPAGPWREMLDNQLRKLDVDYLDVYHMHGISWELFDKYISRSGMALEAAQKAKDEGLIRHISFSFHDTPEALCKIIDAGCFESVTLQYNLLDRANEPGIARAHEKGMGVVVMGPVGGGRLGAPSPEVQALLPGGSKSSAEVALRFVLANPGVSCAISGMSSLAMVEENCATAAREAPLSAEEKAAIEAQLEEKKRLADLYCTGCNYCMPCPNGVNIPGNFYAMNMLRVYGLKGHARWLYRQFGADKENNLPASACVECGECEPKCPQRIPIIAQLKETHRALGEK